MKLIKQIILLAIVVSFSACNDDFLDRDPVNIMNAEQVYSSPEAVEAYFSTLYSAMPVEDFSYCNGTFGGFPGDGGGYTANWGWEVIGSSSYSGSAHSATWTNMYKAIRNVNTFLMEIQTVNITEDVRAAYVAEARFIRAYYYAELVKLFGGVPLILEPQQYAGGSTAELNLPRNKEEEVWEQVKADLDFAAANLPATSVYGRANKYVAHALLSRLMLYAASVAKYGTVQLDGVVGIPASKAATYFQAAYNGAKAVIESGKYSLFKKYTDKAQNFQLLFYELQGNPEAIFCKGWDYEATKRTHSQDLMVLPYLLRAPQGYANRMLPSVALAEMFEYTDGRIEKFNTGPEL